MTVTQKNTVEAVHSFHVAAHGAVYSCMPYSIHMLCLFGTLEPFSQTLTQLAQVIRKVGAQPGKRHVRTLNLQMRLRVGRCSVLRTISPISL